MFTSQRDVNHGLVLTTGYLEIYVYHNSCTGAGGIGWQSFTPRGAQRCWQPQGAKQGVGYTTTHPQTTGCLVTSEGSFCSRPVAPASCHPAGEITPASKVHSWLSPWLLHSSWTLPIIKLLDKYTQARNAMSHTLTANSDVRHYLSQLHNQLHLIQSPGVFICCNHLQGKCLCQTASAWESRLEAWQECLLVVCCCLHQVKSTGLWQTDSADEGMLSDSLGIMYNCF